MTIPLDERLAIVDRLLADPPVVHPMDRSADPVMGVWSTERDCYRFMAANCGSGSNTLETGSGLSTVLFAALGTNHLCVTPGDIEETRIRAYCETVGIPTEHLSFAIGSSHVVLPDVRTPLHLVLVDGGHGFPLPIVDWFYAGNLLVEGGLLVVDDLHLPAVQALIDSIGRDPRWPVVERTPKWMAFRRTSTTPLAEDWTEQPFYVVRQKGAKAFARRVAGRLRREARVAPRPLRLEVD